MGLFGFGKKSVSSKEIDDVVMSHLQELGSPLDIGQDEHIEEFKEMLNKLDRWAESHRFGNWKRATICGSIEASLRQTYKGRGSEYYASVSEYMETARKIIMKTS